MRKGLTDEEFLLEECYKNIIAKNYAAILTIVGVLAKLEKIRMENEEEDREKALLN